MSSPAPAVDTATSWSAGFRVGDVVTTVGAVLALVSTFLPFESNGYGHLSLWHSDFLGSLFAVIVAIAAAVVGTLLGSRKTPLIPALGLSASSLAAVASAAAVLFYAAGLITFSQDYLATAGPTLGALGILAVAVGAFGLASAAPGTGLAKVLGATGAPKTVQPDFGQFAPGGVQAGYGYAQPGWGYGQQPFGQSGQSGPPVPQTSPVEPPATFTAGAGSAPAGAVRVDAAPAEVATSESGHDAAAPIIGRSEDTVARLGGPAEPARPAQAATFSPYWAGVTAPIPAFSPSEATQQVGEVTPGQWYLVTGQHPAGLLIDLRGRPVLVRDVNALIRG